MLCKRVVCVSSRHMLRTFCGNNYYAESPRNQSNERYFWPEIAQIQPAKWLRVRNGGLVSIKSEVKNVSALGRLTALWILVAFSASTIVDTTENQDEYVCKEWSKPKMKFSSVTTTFSNLFNPLLTYLEQRRWAMSCNLVTNIFAISFSAAGVLDLVAIASEYPLIE